MQWLKKNSYLWWIQLKGLSLMIKMFQLLPSSMISHAILQKGITVFSMDFISNSKGQKKSMQKTRNLFKLLHSNHKNPRKILSKNLKMFLLWKDKNPCHQAWGFKTILLLAMEEQEVCYWSNITLRFKTVINYNMRYL